jgi:hypothetical protein
MAGPLVLLIELARRDERRELEESWADDGLAQRLVEQMNRFSRFGTVHRDGRRPGLWQRPSGAGDGVPDPAAVLVEVGPLHRRHT